MDVFVYLRKSRADLEAEVRGEGETLAKHRKQLLALAKERSCNILRIFEEVVSGETIIHRPQMLELLQSVADNKCDGVLVMDIDRLGRGDMQDQGLILDTFKSSKTLIITPRKTYDLNDEFDEEYSEFEAFMARKELKITTRRMQRGRINSVKEGNYIATRPPYGYTIVKDDRGRYLVENKEQADVVRLIFTMYADDTANNGSRIIAMHLNELGIPSYTGKSWSANMVVNIIKNPVYDGKITWKKKQTKKSSIPGQTKEVKLNDKADWIIAEGKHVAIVDNETYTRAAMKMESRYHLPFKQLNGVSNQFAGLIVCGFCGKSIIRRPMGKGPVRMICANRPELCSCRSSKFDTVEDRVIKALQHQLANYKIELQNEKKKKSKVKITSLIEKQLASAEQEIIEYNKQKDNLHMLLERGVYDIETFLERSNKVSAALDALNEQKEKLQLQIKQSSIENNIAEIMYPRLNDVLDAYALSNSAEEKNKLLRSVVDHIVYTKTKEQQLDDFEIELYMLSSDKLL